MKTAYITTFLGVLAYGLLSGRTPLHAQPAPARPLSTSPHSTSPRATRSPTARPPTKSAPTAGSPITVEGDDDKPWNRGVPVATRQAAIESFLEGNRLFNIPLFAQAADKYTAALAQWKHPSFYFNLALTQLNLGQEVEAHENLKQAIRYGEEPLGAEQFQEAQKQLQDLEHQLGRIHITCPTPGAEVTMDGVKLFTGPGRFEGWTTAKAHEITANKPEYLSQARRVTVSPGTLQELDLRLVTLSEAADTGRRWAVWKPWAVVGAGVAIAATGGVIHALSARDFSDYDKRFQQQPCATMGGCTEEDQIKSGTKALLDHAAREQQLAVAGYLAGGSVIAAGVVLLYLNRPRLPEQEPTSSSTSSVAVIPTVSRDMLGLLVSVRH